MMENRGRKLVFIVVVLLVITGLPVAVEWVVQDSYPDQTTVTFLASNGTDIETIDVDVATTTSEMYTGLGERESLGQNEGMLFVHDEEDQQTYTMRGMSFPIDIIFVDEQFVITTIHHAYPNDSSARYSGQAKYVIEVNVNWTTGRHITTGNQIRINW